MEINKFNIIPTNLKLNKPTIKKEKKIYNSTNNNNIKEQKVATPDLTISYNKILELYNIKTINDMEEIVNDKTNSFYYINRIFIAWTFDNFDVLKTHNNIFINMCHKLLLLLLPKIVKENDLKKHIKNYLEFWFEKNTKDSFSLNIMKDMETYFIKKFNI